MELVDDDANGDKDQKHIEPAVKQDLLAGDEETRD